MEQPISSAAQVTTTADHLTTMAPAPDRAAEVSLDLPPAVVLDGTSPAEAAHPGDASSSPPPPRGPVAEGIFLTDPRTLPACELTPHEALKAAKKRALLLAAREPFAAGATLEQACRYLPVGPVKLCKLMRPAVQHLRSGHDWLDRIDFLLAAPASFLVPKPNRAPRPDPWADLLKIAAVADKLNELYGATIGASSSVAASDRRTGKISVAIRAFSYERECPEADREKLRKGYQPKSWVRWLAQHWTPDVEAKFRGPKHDQLYGRASRRDWTFRLPDGSRGEIPASYVLSADDMSCNHPFWITGPDGAPMLSRQGLYFLWAKTKVWASVDLVARPRESYRGEDILRAFYRTCVAMGGVPHFVEFERGVWQSRQVSGFRFEEGWLVEEDITREGMADEDWDVVIGGLGECGVTVLYKHNPHHKHIETNFNALQTELGITAREFTSIGRYAGEFERGAKQLRRVRASSHTPAELGFASQAQMADCIAEAFLRRNEIDDRMAKHTRALEQHPLLPITPAFFGACLPGQPRPIRIRGGLVSSKGMDFRDDILSAIGDGVDVGMKFDETDPNLGCALYNLMPPGNPRNVGNGERPWRLGEFIGAAARELPGPKMELSRAPAGIELTTAEERYGRGAVDFGDAGRRSQNKFVATQFRAVTANGRAGQPHITKSAEARDGRGNLARMEERAGGNEPRGAGDVSAALPPRARRTAAPSQLPYHLRKLLAEEETPA